MRVRDAEVSALKKAAYAVLFAGFALCVASIATGSGPLSFVGFGPSMAGLGMSVAHLMRTPR